MGGLKWRLCYKKSRVLAFFFSFLCTYILYVFFYYMVCVYVWTYGTLCENMILLFFSFAVGLWIYFMCFFLWNISSFFLCFSFAFVWSLVVVKWCRQVSHCLVLQCWKLFSNKKNINQDEIFTDFQRITIST